MVRVEITDAGRSVLAKADTAYIDRLRPVLAELDDPGRFIDDITQFWEVLDARVRARESK